MNQIEAIKRLRAENPEGVPRHILLYHWQQNCKGSAKMESIVQELRKHGILILEANDGWIRWRDNRQTPTQVHRPGIDPLLRMK